MRKESLKRRVRERHARKGGLTASYLEPDRDVDLESDLGAIKSSVRSGVYDGYDTDSSEEGERLERAKRDDVMDEDKGERDIELSYYGVIYRVHIIVFKASSCTLVMFSTFIVWIIAKHSDYLYTLLV